MFHMFHKIVRVAVNTYMDIFLLILIGTVTFALPLSFW